MILTESPHHEKPVGDAVTRRLIEIESLADFDAHISKTRQLNGWFVQSVDLTERADVLTEVDPRGAVLAVSSLRLSSTLSAGQARCSFHGYPICPSIRTVRSRTTPSSFTAPTTTHPAWTPWCTPGLMLNRSGHWQPS